MLPTLFALFFVLTPVAQNGRGFILCGERIRFASDFQPSFTARQLRESESATRDGLAKWAATKHGHRLIAFFDRGDFRINVTEDRFEDGIGRAPQPGLATLASIADSAKIRTFDLILNPRYFRLPAGMTPLLNMPATPADMMAAAWAGEMMHIELYAHGVSLPHHNRAEFQEEWRAVAEELGVSLLDHDDYDSARRRHRG
jgi:hypothetical protein